MTTLFTPVRLGDLDLKNRIVMAPMTRSRADAMGVPAAVAAAYYAQRAGAGLIITEATQISFEGMGYSRTPGVHTPEQLTAWRTIVDTVHAVGGRIVCQLWHVGRIAHPANRGVAADVVAPSAIAAPGQMWTDQHGMQDHPTPRALATDEVARLADEYAQAAVNALEVGFDGVELHAANGYLLHQFLSTNANRRDDRYGGSIENRVRAALEVLDAILARVPAGKVGIRVSPGNPFNGIEETDSRALYAHFYRELSKRGLAYVHVIRSSPDRDVVAEAKADFTGPVIVCGGLDGASAEALLASGQAEATAFGSLFIANPDLPVRLRNGGPLASGDRNTFYSPGPKGYSDYPVWDGTTA